MTDTTMRVVATAGHVDHGKSTLVRALTGMEPDRFAEERRRGMTIDLGYAWTTLPSGADVAFVDVPGHQRFIGNMLAGLGPVPAVLFVVAADEGWSRQSEEHLAAIDALAIERGVLAVTRSDLADPAAALEQARTRIRRSSLGDLPSVAVSGTTGAGLDELRDAVDAMVIETPAGQEWPMRLWVDRVFTVRGAGTVVTGTLGSGRVAVGDTVDLGGRRVGVRGIEALGRPRESVSAPARVALNLRGVERDDIARGDVLTAPGRWWRTGEVDARLHLSADRLPTDVVMHVGTAAAPVRLRPLGGDIVRIRLPQPLPLRAGDRAVLRDPGRQVVAAGVQVLDADPPALRRRGSAAAWAGELTGVAPVVTADRELRRRRAMTRAHLRALGTDEVPRAAREVGEWLVDETAWKQWSAEVPPVVAAWAEAHPLDPGMPLGALRQAIGLPDEPTARAVVVDSGLTFADGRVHAAEPRVDLGAAEAGVREVEEQLGQNPFAAPEAHDLARLGLSRREIAAATKAGRLLRLDGDVLLLPSAIAEAVRRLAELPQPFTTSAARQALETTRRVAIPLLEHLDSLGQTLRVDAATRRVRSD